MKKYLLVFSLLLIFSQLSFVSKSSAQDYVGSDKCKGCHNSVDEHLGYNVWVEYSKTGHPYKLNPVDGAPPIYPLNTSPGVPNTPDGTTWDDFAYVIGGYGWKARFVKKNGRIFTKTEQGQYNLDDGSWVPYHLGEEKKYNAACFKCHTTGPNPEGSWNGVPEDSLGTFSEPGIRCEGCHGPGSEHISDPLNVSPPNTGNTLKKDRCAECHNRGGTTNAIPVSGGFIRHHEQINELNASPMKNLTCTACHDPHLALRYEDAAGEGLSAINKKCGDCHADKQITINGYDKTIECTDCHMPKASKSAIGRHVGNGWVGDLPTHIFNINTDPVTKEAMFTEDGGSVKLDENGEAAVTLDFACLGCHTSKDVNWASEYAKGIHDNGINITEAEYVGSNICKNCHNKVNENLGYNIWQEYTKTGHPYKLNPVNGKPPVYPPNTSPGVPNTPDNTSWDDYAYVIGGYGWKARFVKKDGRIYTATEDAQYNLADGSWVPYHLGEEKKYDAACFKCHTTGAIPEGSWNGVAEDSLGTMSEPGIRCEGCHGPGSLHVASLGEEKLPNTGNVVKKTRCGECHNRGGTTNAIPVSGGFIRHHEQINELNASPMKNLSCATCHDAHIALRYEDAAGEGLKAITKTCESCHSDKQILLNGSPKGIECTDCHMPLASKSAIGLQVGNGWRGDLPTHIFNINTDPVTKDAMFTEDGGSVKLDDDGEGAVTLDFVCLRCHTDEDVAWASSFAKDIHEKGITSVANNDVPKEYLLMQNYPNPANNSTTIKFAVPQPTHIKLTISDMNGRKILNLLDEFMPAANHQVTVDTRFLINGIYIYTLSTNGKVISSRKMIIKR